MRIPFSWLSEFVNLGNLSAEEVAQRLSLRSVEAEVNTFGVELDGVVYGRVLEVKPHTSGKSLWVVRVQIGEGTTVRVVTADPSLQPETGVLVALPNAKVGERCVTKREFDGVVSEGVLLSPQDLGLEEDREGVLVLEGDLKPGTDASDLLGFGEKILILDITPNRGDLLSVKGLARDLSALFGLERKERRVPLFEEENGLEIRLEDRDCSRYRGVIVEGVRVGRSPLWMRVRLWQSGMRTINNVVDVTNYVLIQEGQPLHAFDLDTLEGGIVVRSARQGETIRTLDGEERALDPEILVIADEKKPIAVAGVIGGLDTAVTKETGRLLLEAAHFDPVRVRRGSRILGIQTESSYRFERGVDLEKVAEAQNIAVELILKTSGGRVLAVRDVYPEPYTPRRILLSAGKFRRYAGEAYNPSEVKEIFDALEIPCSLKECGVEVHVPSHRSFDLQRDVDLIEEIMRVKGYETFSPERPRLPVEGRWWRDPLLEVKKYLRDRGLCEVVNISYEDAELYRLMGISPPALEILNPLVPSQRYMRSSLLPSLIRTALYNENHHSYDLGIFEVGRVFTGEGEEERLGVLVKGVRTSYPFREWNPYDLSEILQGLSGIFLRKLDFEETSLPFLHPHVQAAVILDGEEAGFVGRLHPDLSQKLEFRKDPLVAEIRLDPLFAERLPHYRALSKYPPVVRDLALLVDKNLPVSKLLNEIKSHLGDKMEEAMVFDLYAGEKVGEGKKSVGVRVVLRSFEGSLSSEEANALIGSLIRRLRELLGVEIR